jgi:hypothetical protein
VSDAYHRAFPNDSSLRIQEEYGNVLKKFLLCGAWKSPDDSSHALPQIFPSAGGAPSVENSDRISAFKECVDRFLRMLGCILLSPSVSNKKISLCILYQSSLVQLVNE